MKCPYCYRTIGNWQKDDPILLPNGSPYKWSDDTHLIYVSDISERDYKGISIISEELKEIQDNLKSIEETILSIGERTIFSEIEANGKYLFKINHLVECRESIEKLLVALGLTKQQYFNYDENNNHIIHPSGDKLDWIDPIIDEKFEIKYIHIEELRHCIQYLWQELWTYDGIHPEVDKSGSWHNDSGGYWSLVHKSFDINDIYGNHTWDYMTHPYHEAVAYIYPHGYSDFNYHLLQSGGILLLTTNSTAALTTSNESAASAIYYDWHIGSFVDRTFSSNTKIKLSGVLISETHSNGGSYVAMRLGCMFTKKTLLSLSPKTYFVTYLFKDLVLFSKNGTLKHYEGQPRYYIEGGKLYYYKGYGSLVELGVNIVAFSNVEYNLVDLLNYEWNLIETITEPTVVGESYISNVSVSSIILWVQTNAYVPSHGYGTGLWTDTVSLNFTIDDIKLIV